MKINVFDSEEDIAEFVSDIVIHQVKQKPNSIVCFATGKSPLISYEKIVEKSIKSNISFKDVITFNLDEYVGIEENSPFSYHSYMNTHLFSKLDFNASNINIPSGCGDLDKSVEQYNSLLNIYKRDIQILGIGVNGHIGFNEPGTPFDSETRVIKLSDSTIEQNSKYFKDNEIPSRAITMGIKNILDSKLILLIACGKAKANAVKKMVVDKQNINCPASSLQKHSNVLVLLDREASSLL